jgi:hypothetical protein
MNLFEKSDIMTVSTQIIPTEGAARLQLPPLPPNPNSKKYAPSRQMISNVLHSNQNQPLKSVDDY